ncbi:coiled-coil-helix-coiled-coil-helix domain-containing protein 7 isoform X4 [Delphinapterus leucas]|uniref:Coiled-coil-helix-coiled-coil-helix domain-containing protein 7 isoform X4 n=1 Tax=Delphinapterus leucas TaxID=9749 RepID=A0A2Y9LS34_DELLE|nr:coiled-coil-helix-coiled-coil-helix domain-containing protein 7 isoform X4 [Delphinapterus leucas]
MAELTFQVLVELMRFTSLYCHPLCNSSPTSACRKKTGRMPVVAGRLRDPDINPCLLMPFHLLNDTYLTYLRNLMLLPDVWMNITMTEKGVPLTS